MRSPQCWGVVADMSNYIRHEVFTVKTSGDVAVRLLTRPVCPEHS
jgi:hypothetical protein